MVLNFEEKDEYLDNHYFGLEEVKELHINPKEKNNHLLIEGDNYYALKALQVSRIKVDVIYIDPPYNTGNKDFVYNDSFVEKDDQYKHSKWLSFMKNRLTLARELLADDGVIFVSINDFEQAYLKVLMDEIFGEDNFIACLARETKTGGGRFGKQYIQKDFDYIICFSKNINLTKEFKNIDSNWDDYKFKDKRGRYSLKHPLDGGAGKENYTKPILIDGVEYKPRLNWSFSEKRINFMIKNNFLEVNKKGKVYIKNYKDWEIKEKDNNLQIIPKDAGVSWSSSKLINKKYNNATATNELKKIMMKEGSFSYPKPTILIKDLIKMIDKENVTVLDFFAGSGTTAQAILELNEEDKQKRRFIICQIPEVNEEIIKFGFNNVIEATYERIYRISNGKGTFINKEIENNYIDWEYSKDKKSLNDNSMKYLKVKPIHNINGEYEEINDMKKIYKNEFDKDLSVKDFK